MKPTTLMYLAGILILLIVIGFIVKRESAEVDLTERVNLVTLSEGKFQTASSIKAVKMYLGLPADTETDAEDKEKKGVNEIVLFRKNDSWVVSGEYDAPGNETKIADFIKKIRDMKGEFRAEIKENATDFGLDADNAIHIELYKSPEMKKTALHLMVGKKLGYENTLVATADQKNKVYLVDVNIRNDMGMWGEGGTAPKASNWVNKTVVDLDTEKIKKLYLSCPDKKVLFEKKSKGEENEKNSAEKDKKKEFEWVALLGPEKYEFKKSDFKGLLKGFAPFTATEVVDPRKFKEYGLENPGFRCQVETEDGTKTTIIAHRKAPDKDAYCCLEGNKDTVYKVKPWKFEKVFYKGKDLFKLKSGIKGKNDTIKKMTWTRDGVKLAFERTGKKGKKSTWKLLSPRVDIPLKKETIEDLSDKFMTWKPIDYADAKTQPDLLGFDTTGYEINVTMEDNIAFQLKAGAQAKSVEGYYISTNKSDVPLVASKSDYDSLVVNLKSFFDNDIVEFAKDKVKAVTLVKDGTVLTAKKIENEWTLSTGEFKDIKADSTKIKNVIETVKKLKSVDVLLPGNKAGSTCTDKNMIKLELQGETSVVLRLGEEKDSKVALMLQGRETIFKIDKSDSKKVLPALESLADRSVCDIKSSLIERLTAEQDSTTVTLVKGPGKWTMKMSDGKTVECRAERVNSYLDTFKRVVSDGISFDKTLVSSKPSSKITITQKGGKNVTISTWNLINTKSGVLQVSGSSVIYTMSPQRMKRLFPNADKLKKAPNAVEKITKKPSVTKPKAVVGDQTQTKEAKTETTTVMEADKKSTINK